MSGSAIVGITVKKVSVKIEMGDGTVYDVELGPSNDVTIGTDLHPVFAPVGLVDWLQTLVDPSFTLIAHHIRSIDGSANWMRVKETKPPSDEDEVWEHQKEVT